MHGINEEVFFNKTWCDFAKEGKLCAGDLCVFQKTATKNKFEVAVFDGVNYGKFNRSSPLRLPSQIS